MSDLQTVVGHVLYCLVHHNLKRSGEDCFDSWLPGDCKFVTAMIVIPNEPKGAT